MSAGKQQQRKAATVAMGKRKHEETEQTAKQQEPEEAVASEEADSDEGSDMPSDSESDEEPSSGSSSGSEDGSSGPEVSDDAEDADSDDPDAFDKIDVKFEFFDPKESDFHGLKALLHSYLDGQQYDSSPLIDAIIQQVRSHHRDCSCHAALDVDCTVDWHECGACAD